MKWMITSWLLAATLTASAEGERPDRPEYLATGRLLTVRVVPMDRTAKLFFAGHKAADLDLKREHKLLEITALNPTGRQSETLKFNQQGDAYVIQNLPKWKEPFQLNLKSEARGEIEEIKVQIKPKKP
jgi:hypothetical protein